MSKYYDRPIYDTAIYICITSDKAPLRLEVFEILGLSLIQTFFWNLLLKTALRFVEYFKRSKLPDSGKDYIDYIQHLFRVPYIKRKHY